MFRLGHPWSLIARFHVFNPKGCQVDLLLWFHLFVRRSEEPILTNSWIPSCHLLSLIRTFKKDTRRIIMIIIIIVIVVVVVVETHKLLRGFDIQTDRLISARRSDLTIINNKKKTCKIVVFAVQADNRKILKEYEKKDEYLDLIRELKKQSHFYFYFHFYVFNFIYVFFLFSILYFFIFISLFLFLKFLNCLSLYLFINLFFLCAPLNLVASVSGARIINEPWVWYSHNILLMKYDKSKQYSILDPDSRCSFDS